MLFLSCWDFWVQSYSCPLLMGHEIPRHYQVGFQVTCSKVYTNWMDERVDVRWEGNQTRASHKIVKGTLVDTETITAVGFSEWNRCGKIFGWVAICCWGAGSERVRHRPCLLALGFWLLGRAVCHVSIWIQEFARALEERCWGCDLFSWTFKILGLVWWRK